MMYIHLHNLRFRGYHGLYAEEKILANDFECDLSIGFEPKQIPVAKLDETIDYTRVYQLVRERMARPTPLLETVVTDLAESIQSQFPEVLKILISVKKLNPPVNNFEGAVGVSFEWTK